jgi:dCTP deaminase
MAGFWSTETLKLRLPAEGLVDPYEARFVQNCSYELRLGSEVYVTGEDSKTKRRVEPSDQVRIPPGQFANLLTEETVRIPSDALGLISARFKWKQRGLVNVSGFHVDPGYEGNSTASTTPPPRWTAPSSAAPTNPNAPSSAAEPRN